MSTFAVKGLPWTVLRLHRTALLVWGAGLLAATITLIRMYAIGDDARAFAGPCGSPGTSLASCLEITELTVDDTYRDTLSQVATVLSYLMFPVAAWAGGALIGREMENGTAQLNWTQSVSPARWLTAKLALPALLLATGTTTAVLLNVWAHQDGDPNLVGDWYYPDVFVSTGPVAVAYVLAGLSLGALAGLLTRRALAGAGVGFAVTLALYNLLERYREDLWPAQTVIGRAALNQPRSALQIDRGAITAEGQEENGVFACVDSDSLADLEKCKAATGLTDFWATQHPRSHFWPLQFVESGIVLALSAVAVLTAFLVLRRRTP
ncbi:hypothetical protein [Streptomyces cavernae]|uniref:hypothetical protein n=1 Tax=Streptomyces cavernae TaxID=2259034 RepID=UPI001EE45666|nr:hypothetical protein [Streptomyces cavernae]